MGVRLPRHFESGLTVAKWLLGRPEVTRVMHPALPNDPGHQIWKRDFTGASSLFGFVLNTKERKRVAAMLDGMKLFGMGASWGGFESLLIPTWPEQNRTATKWAAEGQTMRIHIGLEDPEDLIADLEAGFARLNGT
jgi:cystathionine beta-lyase